MKLIIYHCLSLSHKSKKKQTKCLLNLKVFNKFGHHLQIVKNPQPLDQQVLSCPPVPRMISSPKRESGLKICNNDLEQALLCMVVCFLTETYSFRFCHPKKSVSFKKDSNWPKLSFTNVDSKFLNSSNSKFLLYVMACHLSDNYSLNKTHHYHSEIQHILSNSCTIFTFRTKILAKQLTFFKYVPYLLEDQCRLLKP